MPVPSPARPSPAETPEAAYTRLRERLVEIAYLLTFDRAGAQDLVQDAFAAALPRWSSIDDPAAYLRRSVTHGAYRAARDGRRRADKHRRAAAEQGDHADRIDLILDQIRDLPAKERAVVVLRFYLDLPISEIADQLDMRQGSVGPTLTRALRRLEGGLPA